MLEFQPIASLADDIKIDNVVIKKGKYFHVDAYDDARILLQDPQQQSKENVFGGYITICKNYNDVVHLFNSVQHVMLQDLKAHNVSEEDT